MLKKNKKGAGKRWAKRSIVFRYLDLSAQRDYSNSSLFMQLSPLSTLESSFEVLNVKKFDGDLNSHSLCFTCLRCGIDIVLKMYTFFQLHLLSIPSIIRHQHNLMKVEQRVF